jgi:A/G-specific adenine glycosylase
MTIARFQNTILNWYKHNRRDLPWRRTRDPYKILVSEVMLQQTQIARVIPKYKEFLGAFPNLSILARARIKQVLKVWQGLGYWKRALNLKATAKTLAFLQTRRAPPAGGVKRKEKTEFEQKLSDPTFLETLPGIGHYTARALACFASGSQEAFLDTNIRRVYLHFFFRNKKNVSDKEILPIAQKALASISHGRFKLMYPTITPREWHYALFDYGALVLKDKRINKRSKHYAKQSKFEGSLRSLRTKIMHVLLDQPNQTATRSKIERILTKAGSPYSAEKILASLEKDGLIKKRGNAYSL